jgi:hypothetical protein
MSGCADIQLAFSVTKRPQKHTSPLRGTTSRSAALGLNGRFCPIVLKNSGRRFRKQYYVAAKSVSAAMIQGSAPL